MENNGAINLLDQATQQNAAVAEESNAASAELALQADLLKDQVSQFIYESTAAVAPPRLRQDHAWAA